MDENSKLISKEMDDTAVGYTHRPTDNGQNADNNVPVSFREIISLLLLVFINLINYMDRLTIAGILPIIKPYFDLNDKEAGLLQTIFTCSYMLFAPLFGYLGDRYPRKYVISIGIFIWSAMTLAGSFINKDQVIWFFVIRGLVGIGEASYSTVAPTIIADIFVGQRRTLALSVFYFAIPCGSGLGYIVGSEATKLMNSWRWALRVSPGFGALCSLLCVMVLQEPERGIIEIRALRQDTTAHSHVLDQTKSNYIEDLKYLFNVKSFVWATVGTTLVSFVVGGLAFWAPTFIYDSQLQMGKSVTVAQVSLIVGIITFCAGLTGVIAGAEISRQLKVQYQNTEALVCAFGILIGAPLLFGALFLADKSIVASWVLIFLAEVSLCLYWVPNADLRLAVIVPKRRSTAEAMQILSQHLFGDASSPFIIGAITDAIHYHSNNDEQTSLVDSLYITPFLSVLGATAYLFCSLHLIRDKAHEVRDILKQDTQANDNNHPLVY